MGQKRAKSAAARSRELDYVTVQYSRHSDALNSKLDQKLNLRTENEILRKVCLSESYIFYGRTAISTCIILIYSLLLRVFFSQELESARFKRNSLNAANEKKYNQTKYLSNELARARERQLLVQNDIRQITRDCNQVARGRDGEEKQLRMWERKVAVERKTVQTLKDIVARGNKELQLQFREREKYRMEAYEASKAVGLLRMQDQEVLERNKILKHQVEQRSRELFQHDIHLQPPLKP